MGILAPVAIHHQHQGQGQQCARSVHPQHNTLRQLFVIHTLYQSNTDTTLSFYYPLLHLGEELLPVCHGPDELGLGGDEAGEQPLAGVDEGAAQLPPAANRGQLLIPML